MSKEPKLTPMMQQYFEVKTRFFSPVFRGLFVEFSQRENEYLPFADVRPKALIFSGVGITKWV